MSDPGAGRPEEGLFPEPARHPLHRGDRVRVQTIWGYELGTITDITRRPYPTVEVHMERGDTITINVARVAKWEDANG